jgi:glycosyltransferase involved in cell wall biosynthesis
MHRKRLLVTISVPVFNEEGNIARLYSRLVALATSLNDRCDFEFLFTDNHSTDATWPMLCQLAHTDGRLRAIRFARNVGFQRSILVNYLHARGDVVLQLDADLQDPPELLPRFLELWEQGYQVVYGVRSSRPEHKVLQMVRKAGYSTIDRLSTHRIPRNAGDFRLVDRRVISALKRVRTPEPYLRGMIAGLGFRQIGVDYDRASREAGQSKFGLVALLKLGLEGVFNHSTLPLRLATWMGLALLGSGLVGAAYYVLLRLLNPELPQGLASIHILVLLGIGLQALLTGILGEYLLRIYLILRDEPIAISEATVNIADEELSI